MNVVHALVWWLRRHGTLLALWLGLALGAAALLLDRLAVQPLAAQQQRLERAARTQPDLRPVAVDPAATAPLQQLQQFHAYFQRAPEPTELLRKLSTLATQRGLVMQRADYVMTPGSGEHAVHRYQLVLPLRGSYPVIRGFVMAALRELPTLSLDQLQLQRKDVGDSLLDAQLSFSIYYAPR